MDQNPRNVSTDLRGVGGLAVDAVGGIVDIVESLHHTISLSSGLLEKSEQSRTRGITGLVYRNIRFINGLVGVGFDALLEPLGVMMGDKESPPAREAVLGVLNGVLGDHLVARDNPLAIPMQFRLGGNELNEQMLADAVQQGDGRVAVLVHGACMSDLQWNRKGHDHGAALARDLGYAPLYLHYNSGLHVSENGRLFADQLQTIFEQSPQPLELAIIGYSMGGLVARSACHYGKTAGQGWLNALQKLVFLGTPHHGAPLERGSNWINIVMEISPYSAPFARLGKIRSRGLTDLRYGNVSEADWRGTDRFGHTEDERIPVPLPAGVDCFAIAATTNKDSNKLGNDLVGDGLVPVNSALGRHKNSEMDLGIPESRQWIGRGMNHLDLLNNPQVYETIKGWVEG